MGYKSSNFGENDNDVCNSTLVAPNLWTESFGLEDIEIPELPLSVFDEDSISSERNSNDSSYSMSRSKKSSIVLNDWCDSVTQESFDTIPLSQSEEVHDSLSINTNCKKQKAPSAHLRGSNRKMRRRPVPDELKDDRYWNRRLKNNASAKRSRDARRQKETEIEVKAKILEQRNQELRLEVSRLSAENSELRYKLSKFENQPQFPIAQNNYPKNQVVNRSHSSKRMVHQPSFYKSFDMS
ncbi:hypothetical protein Ciccas_010928 [Cichlidogyrus casuarinus]|uniref:BZIP domain-containing protein n=1 Tax=Cichlidogyrus casuarinus TaxID=1844966 RepID=A0ABD2PXD7_9PLAT